jgi:nucleotide-binding universal stress UspA family protein
MDTSKTQQEGVIRLGETSFESHEVPHYFLTSGRKWLVCIDGSSMSKLALYHALDLMNPEEDSLVLVHAAKKSRFSRFSRSSKEETQPAEEAPEPDSVRRCKGYLAHASALVKQWSGDVKYTTRMITAKDPREAICDVATEEKADYIVMGSRGMNPLRQMIMGSVSTYVSANAACPVIVIRQSEEERRHQRELSKEEKRAQKRLAEEKKAKAKKAQYHEESQTKVHLMPKTTAEMMGQPHMAPPVSDRQETGPIVPSETTIPVMEK